MRLAPGTRLGPYEIVGPLGAGGMGEVYRARDTRLNRTVAIKVLPPALAGDAQFRSRFKREAAAIGSLNHPHICVLHDIGDQDGVGYLVMEHLEGETLADRLRRGPLPFDQVLAFGIEMADALARAHQHGVVHRDLKPGNVMLTPSGTKLLDFGLAQVAPLPADSGVSHALTESRGPVTTEGAIVGTLAYMAPEQLEGQPADERSDIFALGAVLYEMTTGTRLFQGRSGAAVVAAVMHGGPDVLSWPGTTASPRFRRVVAKCLASAPEGRWQSASDLAEELRWIAEERQMTVPAAASARRERIAWAVAAVAVVGGLAAVAARRAAPAGEVVRLSVVPPPGVTFTANDITAAPQFALAPDGRRLAYVAAAPGERPRLWVRTLDSIDAQPLPATEDASGPFWSPDSSALGFFSRGRLRRVGLAGGLPQDLASTALDVVGGAWNRDGVIVFGSPAGGLSRVAAIGGTVSPVGQLDATHQETSHRWPQFLPDGRHLIFHVRSADAASTGVYLGELDSSSKKQLLRSTVSAVYAPGGSLLFEQGGTLMMQGLDERSGSLRGTPTALEDHVTARVGPSHLAVSISDTGVMAYWWGGPSKGRLTTELLWIDRTGRPLGRIGDAALYASPSLSADGRRLVVSRFNADTFTQDLWTYDFASGVGSRLSFPTSSTGRWTAPVWSPDGRQIAYAVNKGIAELNRVEADGGPEIPLLKPGTYYSMHPSDWSPDGSFVVYQAPVAGTGWDVWAFDLREERPRPLVQAPANQVQGRVSPDGRWLAYSSDESGTFEVYVQPLSSPGGKRQVSTSGGSQPLWSRDGKELFYVAADNAVTAVPVTAGARFEVGRAVRLFQTRALPMVAPFWLNYAVSPDGSRFLVNSVLPDAPPPTITVVLNLPALGRAR
ncbi:MAG TPA: protein kinase [Vicinamibacteria bacterium]|jgi:Tol biopolymer transport system component